MELDDYDEVDMIELEDDDYDGADDQKVKSR